MKRCPHCGTEIKDNENYCQHCGDKINVEVINIGPEDILDESAFSKDKNINKTANYYDASYRELDENGFSNKKFVNPRKDGRFLAILSLILSLFGGLGIIPAIIGLSNDDNERYKSYYQVSALISIIWIASYILLGFRLR